MFTLIFIRSSAEYMDIIKGDFSKAASVRNTKVQIWFIKVSWRVAVVGVDGWDSHRTKAEAMKTNSANFTALFRLYINSQFKEVGISILVALYT